MAATKNFHDKKLMILFNEGPVDGEIVVKRKTINNINESATTDDIYTLAQSLVNLQQFPLINIFVDEDYLVKNDTLQTIQ